MRNNFIKFSSNKSFKYLFDSLIIINTTSLFGIYFINFLISLITLPYLIKSYGIDKWGEIVLLQIILNYLLWIIDWSFEQYGSKLISINNFDIQKQKNIFEEIWTAQLILTLFSIFINSIIAIVWIKYKLIFFCFNLTLIGSFFQPYWLLNGLEKIYESSILQLINKLFFTALIFVFINPFSEISTYFLFIGIGYLISGIIFQIRLKNIFKKRVRIVSFMKAMKILKKSFSLYVASFIASLSNTILPMFINLFLGSTNLGMYNVADRVKGICSQITNPISHALFPRMAKKYNNNKIEANIFFKNILWIILSILLIFYIFINIYINNIVSYFTYENIFEVIKVLRILLVSFLINVINELIISHYMVSNGHYKIINKIRIITFSSRLITGLPLILITGILGAAYSNLFSEFVGLTLLIYQFKKQELKKEYLK